MDCPSGCVLNSVCDNNTTFIVSSISIGFVGFCGGRGSVGFVMSKVLYGTGKPAPVQASRGTGI